MKNFVLICALLATPVLAFDADDLMGQLSVHKEQKVQFVETRYLAMLEKPVVSTGEMSFRSPDYFRRDTQTPRQESMVLKGDSLTLERGGKTTTLRLNSRPEILAIFNSIRSVLHGDRATLEQSFSLSTTGTPDNWQLTLKPNRDDISRILSMILVRGQDDFVNAFEITMADGDRTVTTVRPITK